MTRFTPWRPDAAPDQDADLLMDAAMRLNLCKAFPLTGDGDPAEEQFRRVLDALAQCRVLPVGH